MGNVLVLDGMTTPEALAAISRRFSALLVWEQRLLTAELIRAGVDRAQIATTLDGRRQSFEQWRAGQLDQLQAWLLACDRRLH
jgi:hypothetical protein